MTSPTPLPDVKRTSLQRVCRYTFFAFAAIAAFFLITEHGAHLLGWWPLLIILACPLFHIFGHGGHSGHDHGGEAPPPADSGSTQPDGGSPNPDRNSPPSHHHH